jgi:hypothetical protein
MPQREYNFKKGKSGNPNGRPRNSKNKFTNIKLAFMDAFDTMGGVNGLVAWATNKKRPTNQSDFYRILASLLPKNVDLGLQDELLEKYKEFTADELIAKSKELAGQILHASGAERNDKAQEEGKPA